MSASQNEARYNLLQPSTSDLSDLSASTLTGGSPVPFSPPSSARHRPGYQRLASDVIEEHPRDEEEDDIADTFRRHAGSAGLGIAGGAPSSSKTRRVSIQSITRVPVGAKAESRISGTPAPGSADALVSPLTPGVFLSSPEESPGLSKTEGYNKFPSVSSLHSSFAQPYAPYVDSSDTERLKKTRTAASVRSTTSAYDADFEPRQECPTSQKFYHGRGNWLALSILLLSIFSTVFSGIFLGLAIRGPRYGRKIGTHGSLTSANAILLTTIMAKMIELSFVTSVVAFLGQALSRRAFMKEQGRGVTVAELSMRSWIMQPGTVITHFEGVKHAGLTVLGAFSLLAAILATLYTSAASALVQPQLKFGSPRHGLMVGSVVASFANPEYLKSQCETPIKTDPVNQGDTCLQIEHAAQGFHNYQRFLAYWDVLADSGLGMVDQKMRPPGFGMLHEDTQINATWVEVVSVPDASKQHGRIINNVSLAMPHAGIYAAASDPRNHILQPEDLDGIGIFSLHASVPSPVVNVLCANMDRDELAPIVYEAWPNAEKPVNITTWANASSRSTKNRTVVDDVFQWDPSSNLVSAQPPVFAKYPLPYNTLFNHTWYGYGRNSIYLLGRSGEELGETYVLCGIKASQSPFCSTRYNATGKGATMEAICEDPDDSLAYIRSLSNASYGTAAVSNDWPNIGFDWGNSIALNDGLIDANASNARLLTQLILTAPDGPESAELNRALPSPAEALAVLAGCTLLMSTEDAPFVEFWNYSVSDNILESPQTQYFNASLLAQEYGSGGAVPSAKAFLPVLLLVFLLNVFVLGYFLKNQGLVTDFSEPPNLFSLAVNSPPAPLLAGSCGGGPHGDQWKVNFFVNQEGEHLFMESGSLPPGKNVKVNRPASFVGRVQEQQRSPEIELAQRQSLGTWNTVETVKSPITRMYSKLSKRKSML